MALADDPIPLYEINEDSEDLFSLYNVKEYPTAILFYNSEPIYYNGPKFEYDMFNWL